MADKGPSSLTAADALTGAEIVSVIQDASSRRTTVADIARTGGASPVTTQGGTTYTALLADANSYIRFTNASAISFTIPPDSSVAFPIGTVIEMEQAGGGALTVVAGSGVTIASRGADLTLAGQYAVAALKKVDTDTWILAGDL